MKWAEGGFTTNLGKFSAKWEITETGYELEYDAPSGTSGALVLPLIERAGAASSTGTGRIEVDGEVCLNAMHNTDIGTATVQAQKGGKHSIIFVY